MIRSTSLTRAAGTLLGRVICMSAIASGACSPGYPTPQFATLTGAPAAFELADLDGNGILDLVVALDGAVSVSFGTGGRLIADPADPAFSPNIDLISPPKFGSPRLSVGIGAATSLAIADLDGDGVLDVLLAGLEGEVAACVGNGDGSLQAPRRLALLADVPLRLEAADLNGDARIDVVVGTSASASSPTDPVDAIQILLGSSDGSTRGSLRLALSQPAPAIALADLDQDATPDLITAELGGLRVRAGTGRGDFEPDGPLTASGAGHGLTSQLAVGDVNRDGRSDLVLAGGPAPVVEVFLGTAEGVLLPPIPSAVAPGSILAGDFALADLDGDQTLDVALPDIASRSVLVAFGDGGAGFEHPRRVEAAPGPWAVRADGRSLVVTTLGVPDAPVIQSLGSVPIHVELGSEEPRSIAVGDIDGDGVLDVASGNVGSVTTLLTRRGRKLARIHTLPIPSLGETLSIAIVDTPVGAGSLVVADAERALLLWRRSDGTFEAPMQLSTPGEQIGAILTVPSLSLSSGSLTRPTVVLASLGPDSQARLRVVEASEGSFVELASLALPGSTLPSTLRVDFDRRLFVEQSGLLRIDGLLQGLQPSVTTLSSAPGLAGFILSDLDGDGALDVAAPGSAGIIQILWGELFPQRFLGPEQLSVGFDVASLTEGEVFGGERPAAELVAVPRRDATSPALLPAVVLSGLSPPDVASFEPLLRSFPFTRSGVALVAADLDAQPQLLRSPGGLRFFPDLIAASPADHAIYLLRHF